VEDFDATRKLHLKPTSIIGILIGVEFFFPLIDLLILRRIDPFLDNDSVNILAQANSRNDKTSVARQRISKHTLTIEAVFSAWYVQSGCKEVFRRAEQ
jgi:hypothetical protein